MYEEQELTMQVFSEPDIVTNEPDINVSRIYLCVCHHYSHTAT